MYKFTICKHLYLSKQNISVLLSGSLAAFGTYFCMYAFRKPFTVATYENIMLYGVDYKIVIIIAQVLGYMLSKFIGIKFIAELKSKHRLFLLLGMIGIAEFFLLLFALIPPPYNFICMFFNGIPLGIIWGIVFSYLEGRKITEILSIVLCSSFIVSSGAVKSVGLSIMQWFGINEFWMPVATGTLFIIPFTIFALMLERLPKPTTEDIALRTKRVSMTKDDRKNLVLSYLFPIVILVVFYMSLTALRDYRDNFSREIWDAVGFTGNASIYTFSEIPVAILVLVIIGSFGFIKNNYKVFVYYHYLIIAGAFLIGLSTIGFQLQIINPVLWMICIGFGLYVCYVPFNCIFFDRMIATFKIKGNAGFLIYIADAFGYLGSIAVLLYKNFGAKQLSWLKFFSQSCYVIAILGIIIGIFSLAYFKNKHKQIQEESMPNMANMLPNNV